MSGLFLCYSGFKKTGFTVILMVNNNFKVLFIKNCNV